MVKASTPFPRDTTEEASRVQHEVWRRLGDAGRFRATMQLCAYVRELAAAGVRHEHPEYTDHQVRLAVIRRSLGDDLFRKAYPHAKIDA